MDNKTNRVSFRKKETNEGNESKNVVLTRAERKIEKAKNKAQKDSHKFLSAERYAIDANYGLTQEQVDARIENGLTNIKPINRTKSYARIIFENVFNFCNTVTMSLCVLLIAVGMANKAVSSCIIFINMAIGIIQEIKAKHTVEKLSLVVDSMCDVIREGERKSISTRELVLDDIFVLTAGMQVPVDCVLTSGYVELDESILTGESEVVKKNKGNSALAASYVVAGEAFAHVERVGEDCYIENVAKVARRVAKPKSNIFNVLDKIIKGITCGLIPLAVLLLISTILAEKTANEVISEVAGSVIGMLPVGMFLLTSTAMASAVIKLTKKNTLTQDLYGVEMLAMVDTLLLDKTGTITDGNLEVVEEYAINGAEAQFGSIIRSLVEATHDKNPTALALSKKYADCELIEATNAKPFSSARKCSSAEINGVVYCLGAPDYVVNDTDEITQFVDRNSEICRRTLVLARCEGTIEDISKNNCVPLYAFALEDKLRDDVKETMEWFADNGVDIKIVSGDNPKTVSQIALKTGVVGAENYLNCGEIGDELVCNISDTTVFGRVSPEQKCDIVKALQRRGKVVGMIGDGVNDVQALKEADCSISFASANEVARNISRIILLDNNFKTLPEAVKEGRRVIGNVEKVSTLYIMKNIFVMIMTLVYAIMGFVNKSSFYPFTSDRMLLIEFFVIGVPTVAFALQPGRRQIKGSFLRNVMRGSIPAGLSLVVAVSMILIFMSTGIIDMSGFTGDEYVKYYGSLAMVVLTMAGFSALIIVSMPPNWFRLGVTVAMLAAAIGGLLLDNNMVLFGKRGWFFDTLFITNGTHILWIFVGIVVAAVSNIIFRIVLHNVEKKHAAKLKRLEELLS